MDKKTEQLEELMVGMEDFLREHIESSGEVSVVLIVVVIALSQLICHSK